MEQEMSSGPVPPAATPTTAMSTVFSERRCDLVVTARETRADGVVSLTLADPSGARLPDWTPGAHIDLILDDSLVRQYSLCGRPGDQHWRIGVLRDPAGRGGSERVHATLNVGQRIVARGPRNHFPLQAAPRYIFLAGGIGITPILPMIAAASAANAEWHLYYGGRTRSSMAFLEELSQYGDRVTVWPDDERGLLPLDDLLGTPDEGVLIYCCGPEGLLSAVEQRCAVWPSGALHLERFAAKPQAEPPEDAVAGFEVVCQRSGVTVAVPPGKSIIDVLEENDVSVLSSCLEGVCGTCETRIVDGTPDHRDSLLSEDEREANEYMMICVSRSLSDRLVLDL
jgi:ferredoxin-NADP reductase